MTPLPLTPPGYQLPTYVQGSLITDTANFTDASGNPADPTTVSARLYTRLGSTPLTPTKTAVGAYLATVDTTPTPGRYLVRWTGVGGIQAATEHVFFVTTSS